MQSSSDEQTLASYYTTTFSVLYDGLTSPPPNFPWAAVLNSVRDKLKNVMNEIDTLRADPTTLKKPEPGTSHELFINQIADRIGLSIDLVLQLVNNYIVSEGPDPDQFSWNESNLERVIDFYYIERQRVADCITTLLRIENEDSENEDHINEKVTACRDTIQYLIDHGLEETVRQQFTEASNFEMHLKKLENDKLSSKQITYYTAYIVEQKLSEKGALLDLMFMLYYNRIKCSYEKFVRLLSLFRESDFGHQDRDHALTAKSHLSITRNICLCCLILIEAMCLEDAIYSEHKDEGEPVFSEEMSGRELSEIDGMMSKLSLEPHHGVLLLLWATCLLFHNHIFDAPTYFHRGLQAGGLQFIANMFDRENAAYPFLSHEENFEGYRSVAKGLISGAFSMFDVRQVSFSLVQQLLSVTEHVIKPRFDKSTLTEGHDALCRMFFEQDIRMFPYHQVLNFVKKLFPARSELLHVLSMMTFDDASAQFAFKFLEEQDEFCMIDTERQIQSQLTSHSTFTDPMTGVVIPPGTQFSDSTFDYGHGIASYLFFNHKFSGWKVCLNQLLRAVRGNTYNPQMVQYFLSLLFKIITFGNADYNHVIDQCLAEIDTSIRDLAKPGTRMLYLICSLLKTMTEKPKMNVEIVALCCNVLHAYANLGATSVEQHVNEEESPVTTVASFLRTLVQSGSIMTIIRTEGSLGKYNSTLAILDTVLTLVRTHPLSKMDNVYDILPFLCSSIFAVHDTWRYRRLEQRWSISCKCLQIFNAIASDSMWNTKRAHKTQAGVTLMQAFFRDSSLYRILFALLGLGGSFFETVLHSKKTEEAKIVERVITEGLLLLESLLKYRMSPASQASEKTTPFEDTLLSQLIGKKQVALITAIFEFIDSPYSPDIRIVSCRVINLIAQLTEQYHPRPPSLVSYLGSQANFLVRRCLDLLRSVGESEELRIAIFNLIATTVQTQRGLAELFLSLNPAHTQNKGEDGEAAGNTFPKEGCIDTILYLLERAELLIEKGQAPVLASALSVLLCIFQRGEHRSITDKLSSDESFWTNVMNVCAMFSANTSLTSNIYVVKTISAIVNILALDLYQSYLLQLQSRNDKYATTPTNESFKPFRSGPGSDNDRDVGLLDKLLDTCVTFIINTTNENSELVQELDERLLSEHIDIKLFVIDNVMSDGSDALYDVNRFARWIPSAFLGEPSTIDLVQGVNRRLALTEAGLNLFDSVYKLISVKKTGPPSENSFDIVLKGLRVHEYELGNGEGIKIPLPKMLDNLMGTLHQHVSRMLVSIMKRLIDHGTAPDVSISRLANALEFQVQRKKASICEDLLACISLLLTTTATTENASEFTAAQCLEIIPSLISTIKTFGNASASSRLSISILAMCANIQLTDDEAAFICRHLVEEISSLGFETAGISSQQHTSSVVVNTGAQATTTKLRPTESIAASSTQQQYALDVLNLLLSMSYSENGAYAIISNGVIPRLTNNEQLSSSIVMYQDGERTLWHDAWKITLKLMCSLLQSYGAAKLKTAQRKSSSRDTMFDIEEHMNLMQTQLFSQQCLDFCTAHQNRLMFSLVEIWETNPRTLAALEEAELTSMLVNGLARTRLLPQLTHIKRAATIGMVRCAEMIRYSHVVLPRVHPISNKEKGLVDLTVAQDVRSRSTLENLGWFTRINLTIYGTLRSLLSCIRCMVEIPTNGGVESSCNMRAVLSLDGSGSAPGISHVIYCIDSCADILKIIASSKFRSDQILTAAHDRSSSSSAASVSSTPSSGFSTTSAIREDSRLLLSWAVIGAMEESLHVAVSHLLLFHKYYQQFRLSNSFSYERDPILGLIRDGKSLNEKLHELEITVERAKRILSKIREQLARVSDDFVGGTLDPVIELMDLVLTSIPEIETSTQTLGESGNGAL